MHKSHEQALAGEFKWLCSYEHRLFDHEGLIIREIVHDHLVLLGSALFVVVQLHLAHVQSRQNQHPLVLFLAQVALRELAERVRYGKLHLGRGFCSTLW